MSFLASFDAQCELCDDDVFEGETELRYVSDYGFIHDDPDECSEEHPDYDDGSPFDFG